MTAAFDRYWRIRVRLPERFGQPCRVEYAKREAERLEKRAKDAREFIRDCHDLAQLARESGKGGVAISLENLL